MERLQACRQDLVLLEGQIAPRDGVPTFEQFSVAWRQLSFSAVHLAANDQMERQLVLDTMCHAATDMLDATLEQRIQVCGVFVLYSLWKTALKGQQFKIPADPSSWPNIINLYNTWERDGPPDAFTALQQLLSNDVFEWVAVHPALARASTSTSKRLWAHASSRQNARPSELTSPAAPVTDGALAALAAIEAEYGAAKSVIATASANSMTALERADPALVSKLARAKSIFLDHRRSRLRKVAERTLRRPSRAETALASTTTQASTTSTSSSSVRRRMT